MAVTINGAGPGNWDSSGNLGIGTTSPNQKLQVHNPIASSSLVQMTNASTGSTGSDGCYFGIDASNNVYVWNQENGPILFGTNNGERMRLDASGNLLFNSGYGSVATAYGCRAWVNFNGTGTVAIRASGNVSSITDNGAGDYTVNFSAALPDTNFSVSGMPSMNNSYNLNGLGLINVGMNTTTPYVTTSSVRVVVGVTANGVGNDAAATYISVAIHR